MNFPTFNIMVAKSAYLTRMLKARYRIFWLFHITVFEVIIRMLTAFRENWPDLNSDSAHT